MRQRDDLFGKAHVAAYRASDGEDGFAWKKGTAILLPTRRGRRSGEERTQPLILREDAGGVFRARARDAYQARTDRRIPIVVLERS